MKRRKALWIYEINTHIWLKDLSQKYKKQIHLGNIPKEELIIFKNFGFNAIWLMGIWKKSRKGREVVLEDSSLLNEFKAILPDLRPQDISCSPYAIAEYEIDDILGGHVGLLSFKKKLQEKRIKLFLDFVPNHLALDHPWVKENPEFFIHGTMEDMKKNPELFFVADNHKTILAYGKDHYFPSWKDVVQLNYFNPQTRQAMQEVLFKISLLCDGVRCDMAMLILKEIQEKIWGNRVFDGVGKYKTFLTTETSQGRVLSSPTSLANEVSCNHKFNLPKNEFWQEAIVRIKERHPEFIFIAEVYWGLESELISLGFDYVYDKPFYDALRDNQRNRIKEVFCEQGELSKRRLRFIENHDEARTAEIFGLERSKAAALIMALAPGGHLFHAGQLQGFKIRVPIQLLRRPKEDKNSEIYTFYGKLLRNLKLINKDNSFWFLLNPSEAWWGNPTYENFIALFKKNKYLAVINYSNTQSQCYLSLGTIDKKAKNITFKDLLNPVEYKRTVEEIASRGIYLDLKPYGLHLFELLLKK